MTHDAACTYVAGFDYIVLPFLYMLLAFVNCGSKQIDEIGHYDMLCCLCMQRDLVATVFVKMAYASSTNTLVPIQCHVG